MASKLSRAERTAMKKAQVLVSSDTSKRAVEIGWRAARDHYRNQDDIEITEQAIDRLREAETREQALREALKSIVDWATTLVPKNDVREKPQQAGDVLKRSHNFFRFLENPWQSQYEMPVRDTEQEHNIK